MSGLKIMVVEDEPVVALNIEQRLERLGYSLSRNVSSGEEAVLAAGQDKPDLILMDIVLAGEMDGIQAAGEIRAVHDIPIVYLTAYADPETLNKAKLTSPFGYIIKPFEDREIQTTIELAFYKHETGKREKAHQQWLSTTLESIGDGVVTTDAEGRVTYMNGVAEVLTGWKSKKAVGRNLSEVFHVLEQGDGGLFSNLAFEIVQKKHIIATDDAVLLLGNDREVPLELFATPILDEKRNLTGMVLAFRDISGRKRNEQILKQNVQSLRRTLEETVNALAMASEKRDPYTAGHQQRVSRLACAIAEE
ncbi:MAG: response regulator, partial [Thermodesulfobacteriota bacterium]|nr:response regulator [Thermodesulfobacteriota bacterium]